MPLRNPYDPQFRGASDLYNQSLEGMLRLVQQEGELRPGMSRTVKTANHTCSFDVVMHSTGWQPGRHRPVRIRQRLQGARVAKPLPHVRPGRAADRRRGKSTKARTPAEQFYPPNVCFPLTAFLRVDAPGSTPANAIARRQQRSVRGIVARARDHRPNCTAFRAGAARPARPPVDRRRRPRRAAGSRPQHAAGVLSQSAAVSGRRPLDAGPACAPATPSSCRACTCSSRSTRTRCRSSWSTACGRAPSPGWKCTTTCAATRSFGSTTSSGSTCIRPASRSGSVPRRCARTWR